MLIMPFVTRRIKAQMQELSLRDAIDLCKIPESLNEYGTSRALQAIVAETNLPLHEWTVQERMAALCHYITAQEAGDWQVSDNGKLSDYLIDEDYPESPYQFDDLEIVPLTGEYAEAVEMAVQELPEGGKWVIGAMAATIRSREEEWNGGAAEFVRENIQRLLDLPESSFNDLLSHFQAAQHQLRHGFDLAYTQDGIAAKGGAGQPPVRFHFTALLGQPTLDLWRIPDGNGADHIASSVA